MFLKKMLVFVLVPLLLVLAVPVASWAGPGTQTAGQLQQISLGDAINMADSSNATLIQDRVAVQMDNNSSIASPTAANAWALQDDDFALTAEQNNVIYQTEVAYFSVQDAVYGVQVAKKALEVAQESYQIAQVQEGQGTQTQLYVTQAKSALDLAQSKLTEAQTGVNTAYVNFDNIVGLDSSMRPYLTSTATYDPNYSSGLADVQQAVSETLKNNPNAQIAKNAYNIAINSAAFQKPGNNGPLYLQNAGLTYQLALQGLTNNATSAFLAVGYDQDAYDAALKAVAVAQVTYSNDEVSYNSGVITKYQLDSDESNLLSANLSLQGALHQLLEDQANLALTTGVGSVNVTVNENQK